MLALACRTAADKLAADLARRRLGADQAPDTWSRCLDLYAAANVAAENPQRAIEILRLL